jgi:aconitate hydratase
MGYFPQDQESINYLKMTNRSADKIDIITQTLEKMGLLRNYNVNDNVQFTDVLELDLASVDPCISGPKRPHDRVPLT